jgi:hypothetical protein
LALSVLNYWNYNIQKISQLYREFQ